MQDKILNGKALARIVEAEVSARACELGREYGRLPKLVVILVGDDPASSVYVRNKELSAERAGILHETIRMPKESSEADLLEAVGRLNADESVDGILVQLPLPDGIDEDKVIEAISPDKDVDGFHPLSMGRLLAGLEGLAPCTPSGIMEILKHYGIDVRGRRAVVVGRSNIVGKPAALMLLKADATVVCTHSRTKDLAAETKQADVLVVAAGRPNMIKKDMIKPGCVIIDVGIHKTENGLCGDVDPECYESAGFYTPVPGGVGPMTVACLIRNTLKAYELRNKRLQREHQ